MFEKYCKQVFSATAVARRPCFHVCFQFWSCSRMCKNFRQGKLVNEGLGEFLRTLRKNAAERDSGGTGRAPESWRDCLGREWLLKRFGKCFEVLSDLKPVFLPLMPWFWDLFKQRFCSSGYGVVAVSYEKLSPWEPCFWSWRGWLQPGFVWRWIFSKAFFLKPIWEVWVKLWEKQKFAVCNHLAHCKLMMGKFFLFPSLFPTLSHLLALSSSSSLFKVLTACSSSCWDVSWRSFCC